MSNLVPGFLQKRMDNASGLTNEMEEERKIKELNEKIKKLENEKKAINEVIQSNNNNSNSNSNSNSNNDSKTKRNNSNLSSMNSNKTKKRMNNNNSDDIKPKDMKNLAEKIKVMDISKEDKINLLKIMRQNIENLTKQDQYDLTDISNKYKSLQSQVQPSLSSQTFNPLSSLPTYTMTQTPFNTMGNMTLQQPNYMSMGNQLINPYTQNPMYSQMGSTMLPQPNFVPTQNSAQIDMLSNKINMLQLEMTDLMQHLKDYTRKYLQM